MSPLSRPLPLACRVDPEDLWVALAAQRAHVFWLDSGPDADRGWSWVGAGETETEPERVRAARTTQHPVPGSAAGPFAGGWVGWIDYDSAAAAAGAPAIDSAAEGGERWMRVRELVAFDHDTGGAWVVTGGDALADFAEGVSAAPPPPPAPSLTSSARDAPAAYADLIRACQDRIRDGDAYQLCLTTAFEVPGAIDEVAVYRRLRRASPSHHGGFVRIGDAALASASPERFLEVSDGVVRTHPIKGTRRRDPDPVRDAALAAELRADPKERAENVMIVDLMRNDLSRVCVPGSVRADRLLDVEHYPAVHQLVSTVSGRLRDSTTLGDLLAAAFPAGSMTGAPKLSAMSILAALERESRGVYAGAFGWVGDDGAADLAMVIRSILITPRGARIGAGGGITWRSLVDAEVAEVALKATAPLAAIGASLPTEWAATLDPAQARSVPLT